MERHTARLSWLQVLYGQSLEFDGESDYVDCGSLPIASGQFTVSAWVRPSGELAEGTLFTLAGEVECTMLANMATIVKHQNGAPSACVVLSCTDSADSLQLTAEFPAILSGPYATESGDIAGSWHHIAYAYNHDTATASLYLDGVLRARAQRPKHANGFSGNRLIIGASVDADGTVTHPFYGRIDDVIVFRRALDESEIAGLIYDFSGDGLADFWDDAQEPHSRDIHSERAPESAEDSQLDSPDGATPGLPQPQPGNG